MVAPLVTYRQRTDALPEITVTCGPLMLLTTICLSNTTRFVAPAAGSEPLAYTPLVTRTASPEFEASIASWIVIAAVAQLVKGKLGAELFESTK